MASLERVGDDVLRWTSRGPDARRGLVGHRRCPRILCKGSLGRIGGSHRPVFVVVNLVLVGTAASGAKRTFGRWAISAKCHKQNYSGTPPDYRQALCFATMTPEKHIRPSHHRTICEMLPKRSADDACRAMRDHLLTTRRKLFE